MATAAPDTTITVPEKKIKRVCIPSDQIGKALLGNPHRPQEAEVTLQPLSLRNGYFAYLGSITD